MPEIRDKTNRPNQENEKDNWEETTKYFTMANFFFLIWFLTQTTLPQLTKEKKTI